MFFIQFEKAYSGENGRQL